MFELARRIRILGAGHIAGAVSLPVDDLERRLAELPADREVTAYRRGPYCVTERRVR